MPEDPNAEVSVHQLSAAKLIQVQEKYRNTVERTRERLQQIQQMVVEVDSTVLNAAQGIAVDRFTANQRAQHEKFTKLAMDIRTALMTLESWKTTLERQVEYREQQVADAMRVDEKNRLPQNVYIYLGTMEARRIQRRRRQLIESGKDDFPMQQWKAHFKENLSRRCKNILRQEHIAESSPENLALDDWMEAANQEETTTSTSSQAMLPTFTDPQPRHDRSMKTRKAWAKAHNVNLNHKTKAKFKERKRRQKQEAMWKLLDKEETPTPIQESPLPPGRSSEPVEEPDDEEEETEDEQPQTYEGLTAEETIAKLTHDFEVRFANYRPPFRSQDAPPDAETVYPDHDPGRAQMEIDPREPDLIEILEIGASMLNRQTETLDGPIPGQTEDDFKADDPEEEEEDPNLEWMREIDHWDPRLSCLNSAANKHRWWEAFKEFPLGKTTKTHNFCKCYVISTFNQNPYKNKNKRCKSDSPSIFNYNIFESGFSTDGNRVSAIIFLKTFVFLTATAFQ